MKSIFLYGLGVWLIILILAVINGIIRDYTYKSHPLSSLILSIVIFLITFLFLKVGTYSEDTKTYLLLGLMWVILTVAFEFLFFHYITNHSWEELISNYNIIQGNLWIIVVISTGIAPWLMSRFIK